MKMTSAQKKTAAEKRKADAAAKKASAEATALADAEQAGETIRAAPAAKPKPKIDEAAPEMITVKTKRGVQSRRRAGRSFGPEPLSIPIGELTEDEISALQDDPSLVVELPVALA